MLGIGSGFLNLGRRRSGLSVFGGGLNASTYAQYLVSRGADEVWPLVDIASGTTIPAFVNGARNGTLTGWDLQNTPGPVPGSLAPYLDGSNDKANIFTTSGSVGLKEVIDFNEISLFSWIKAADAATWTSGVRWIWRLQWGASDHIAIASTGSNALLFRRRQNGANKDITISSISSLNWMSVGLSISATSGEMKAYIDGAQAGSTLTGIVSRTVVLDVAVLGALDLLTPATQQWKGWLAYAALNVSL